jgi:hypothetical protein
MSESLRTVTDCCDALEGHDTVTGIGKLSNLCRHRRITCEPPELAVKLFLVFLDDLLVSSCKL